jgi:hypothetical protein
VCVCVCVFVWVYVFVCVRAVRTLPTISRAFIGIVAQATTISLASGSTPAHSSSVYVHRYGPVRTCRTFDEMKLSSLRNLTKEKKEEEGGPMCVVDREMDKR